MSIIIHHPKKFPDYLYKRHKVFSHPDQEEIIICDEKQWFKTFDEGYSVIYCQEDGKPIPNAEVYETFEDGQFACYPLQVGMVCITAVYRNGYYDIIIDKVIYMDKKTTKMERLYEYNDRIGDWFDINDYIIKDLNKIAKYEEPIKIALYNLMNQERKAYY